MIAKGQLLLFREIIIQWRKFLNIIIKILHTAFQSMNKALKNSFIDMTRIWNALWWKLLLGFPIYVLMILMLIFFTKLCTGLSFSFIKMDKLYPNIEIILTLCTSLLMDALNCRPKWKETTFVLKSWHKDPFLTTGTCLLKAISMLMFEQKVILIF